jgi:spore photoproduct lyase
MGLITHKPRKTIRIDPNNRSSDFILSFGNGCLFNCHYCTCRRFKHKGVNIPTNVDEILEAADRFQEKLPVKIPNQISRDFYMFDISCTEDFCLHAKYYDWKKIFNFFKERDSIGATMATKYVNYNLLDYNPKDKLGRSKIRIRFSLMPQELSYILEPNTSLIEERIMAINTFKKAGYEVHINFSPIILSKGSLELYKELFRQIDAILLDKENIASECIFLTHSERLHNYNIDNGYFEAEELLWKPEIQELKQSQYQSNVLRYNYKLKHKAKNTFIEEYNKIIPYIPIRYIF